MDEKERTEKKKSMLGKIYATLDKTVEKDNSMDGARDQHVPNSYLIPIWLLAKCVYVAALVALTTLSYNSDQGKMYPSPKYSFGSSATYRYCELITASFSGTYLLDSNGHWQGTNDFSLGKAKYMIAFNDFSHNMPITKPS